MTPAPNDRFAILSAKIKEAGRVVARARTVWTASQSRYMQLIETHGTMESVTGAAWLDASATYEVYLDACKVKGDFIRAVEDLRRQVDEARREVRRRMPPAQDA